MLAHDGQNALPARGRWATWSALLLALLHASCSASDESPVYPVEGKAFFRGRPAAGARVFLQPLGFTLPGSARPTGVVEADGSFRLSTFRAFDGAPPGSYGVSLVWLSDAMQQDGENAGPDRLKGKYRDAAKNRWTVSVVPGPNLIEPLELK